MIVLRYCIDRLFSLIYWLSVDYFDITHWDMILAIDMSWYYYWIYCWYTLLLYYWYHWHDTLLTYMSFIDTISLLIILLLHDIIAITAIIIDITILIWLIIDIDWHCLPLIAFFDTDVSLPHYWWLSLLILVDYYCHWYYTGHWLLPFHITH